MPTSSLSTVMAIALMQTSTYPLMIFPPSDLIPSTDRIPYPLYSSQEGIFIHEDKYFVLQLKLSLTSPLLVTQEVYNKCSKIALLILHLLTT